MPRTLLPPEEEDRGKALAEEEASGEAGTPPLLAVLHPFKDVFQEPLLAGAEATCVKHRLRLWEPIDPIRKVPYRLSPVQREVLSKELQEFLERGWIRLSTSPWAAVAIVVPKKDATWRVCIDYRDLNAATLMDAYPLPRIDDLLHHLAQARVYSKVDLHSRFPPDPDGGSKYPTHGVPCAGTCSRLQLL